MVAELSGPRAPKPISQELAYELGPRIMRLSVRSPRRWRRTQCWEMESYIRANGYSSIPVRVDGSVKYYYAHRLMYVYENGPIPDGLTIDHLCENPPCWRPTHLRAVTLAENVLRSSRNPFALHAQQTECVNGHPLAGRPLDRSVKRDKCSECARSKSRAMTSKRKLRRGTLAAGDPRHGTPSGYAYWRCRCDACRGWQSATYLAWKARGTDAP